MASDPKEVAVFTQHLESFFILASARIDLIAEVMTLDGDIGGCEFDISLTEQTEKALKEATETPGKVRTACTHGTHGSIIINQIVYLIKMMMMMIMIIINIVIANIIIIIIIIMMKIAFNVYINSNFKPFKKSNKHCTRMRLTHSSIFMHLRCNLTRRTRYIIKKPPIT